MFTWRHIPLTYMFVHMFVYYVCAWVYVQSKLYGNDWSQCWVYKGNALQSTARSWKARHWDSVCRRMGLLGAPGLRFCPPTVKGTCPLFHSISIFFGRVKSSIYNKYKYVCIHMYRLINSPGSKTIKERMTEQRIYPSETQLHWINHLPHFLGSTCISHDSIPWISVTAMASCKCTDPT